MISFKRLALSVLVTTTLFFAALYSSCKKGTTTTVDKCHAVTCQNGGTCSVGVCTCAAGYRGTYCESVITCPTGYTGVNCSVPAFVGTWHGIDHCSGLSDGDVGITISLSTTDSNQVIVRNVRGLGEPIDGVLSSDRRTITYTNQVVENGSFTTTLNGTIVLNSNTSFTNTYTSNEGVVYSCTGNYDKL